VTVLRADMGAEHGAEDGVYKVCGLRLKFEESEEQSLVGVADHPTVREEEYAMEEGEYIVEVTTHHLRSDLQKGEVFRKEIASLTNISDLSFTTSKGRTLGPCPHEEGWPDLGPGLLLSLPTKLKHLEKNCPGRFHWLAGFGERQVHLADTKAKAALHPVWSLQTHFKVYPVNNPEFEFVSGVKKHLQYSVKGVLEEALVDEMEDITQVERSPVHEVVDLEDSEEEGEGVTSATMPQGDDSAVMVVDSDSAEEEEEEEEESEEDEESDRVPRRGWGGGGKRGWGGEEDHYQARPGDTRGCDPDEPIEIESSSDEEEEKQQGASSPSKGASSSSKGASSSTAPRSNGAPATPRHLPPINGGDADLNLSEDSSDEENAEDPEGGRNKRKRSHDNNIEEDEDEAKKAAAALLS